MNNKNENRINEILAKTIKKDVKKFNQREKIANKAIQLLADFAIYPNDPDFLFLRDNVIAGREDAGLTWEQLKDWLLERLES